jgi:predicted pyridoxine 5'-phosphate oxidase superfamily flavin-nucleotide-binding protein
MNPSAASWSATARTQVDNPKISCTTTTTGALVLLSGYTIHVWRLSPSPVRIIAHSPCRGDVLNRAAAPAASAGSELDVSAAGIVAAEDIV